ncbi:hypothetical protein DSL92_08725 [Billgrantia gudaonensis]|uniref:Uncharacterized protein n=1 Tax=Billgrantia gudaonensis TaxID=376427 RepID=A0A3S0Q0P5_9GAMM|nr:hypothetical protein DSL92_08725 [Halomonas gudaonensis]
MEGPDNPRITSPSSKPALPKAAISTTPAPSAARRCRSPPRMRWATTRSATSSSSPAAPGQSADHPDFRRSQSLGPGRSPPAR